MASEAAGELEKQKQGKFVSVTIVANEHLLE